MGTLTCSSPDDYIDMLLDLTERRRGWDTLFVQGRLLVELDDSTGVAWLAFGGRKCDHPRHAVLVQQRRAVGRDHMFVACSVEDVPPPDIADANQKMDVQVSLVATFLCIFLIFLSLVFQRPLDIYCALCRTGLVRSHLSFTWIFMDFLRRLSIC